jgi:hypothetical protein
VDSSRSSSTIAGRAPSQKKKDPRERGRWNLGEKLVLSLCDEATISTVGVTLRFCPMAGAFAFAAAATSARSLPRWCA